MEPYSENYNIFFAERTPPLHSMLVNCGRQTAVANYRWDGMRRGNREFVIWQYTESGEGALEIEGRTIPQKPGDVMLLIVPEKHCYYLPEHSAGWGVFYLTIYGSESIRLAREYRRRRGASTHLAPDAPELLLAEELFAECRAGRMNDRYLVSRASYSFMMQLLAASDAPVPGVRSDFIARVQEYCMKNLGKDISVDDLARRAGYSRWHFSRLFREMQGVSPQQFVHELKMRMAIRLLQTTPDSIKEIAARCGYDDPGYFCRVFRKYHNLTPGAFRHPGGGEPGEE